MSSPSLVIQTAFIGDMVLTTPLIAALARRGPVDVVGTPSNLPLLANNPHVRRIVSYDKRGRRAIRRLVEIGRELRGERYDAAYLAQGSLRSAALALVAGVKMRVGFDTSGGRHLYTVRVPYEDSAHHSERLLQLLEARLRRAPVAARLDAGDRAVLTSDARPRLYPGRAEHERIEALVGQIAPGGEPMIAIAPGSIWPTKRWPYYPELAARVSEHASVVIIGGAADTPLAEAIRVRAPSATDVTGALSLLESAELISRCAAIVSNDSAPVHLASAMNTPTLAVFGPTVPGFGFGPLATRNDVAGHDALACRPCDRHGPRRCPLGHWRCMSELSADAMYGTLSLLVPEILH